MIYRYDLAVLKREIRKLEAIVNNMKHQVAVLQHFEQTDLATALTKKIDFLTSIIDEVTDKTPK